MKKVLFAVVATLLSFGIFAFSSSSSESKKLTTTYWYKFIDVPGNNPDNPLHYERVDEPTDCSIGNTMCAVKAPPASPSDLEHPDLDLGVREETLLKP